MFIQAHVRHRFCAKIAENEDSVNPMLLSMDSDTGPGCSSMPATSVRCVIDDPAQHVEVTEAVTASKAPILNACDSPGGARVSRAPSQGSRGGGGDVIVHVDVASMRLLLDEWRGRDLHGEVPAGLRIMSQYASRSLVLRRSHVQSPTNERRRLLLRIP